MLSNLYLSRMPLLRSCSQSAPMFSVKPWVMKTIQVSEEEDVPLLPMPLVLTEEAIRRRHLRFHL